MMKILKFLPIAFLFIFINLILSEYIIRQDLSSTFLWMSESGIAFIFNLLIIASIAGISLAITNRLLVTALITVVAIHLFAAINLYKFRFLGEYLFPWDLLLYKNVLNLLPNISDEINWVMLRISIFILVLITAAIFLYYRKNSVKKIIRLSWKSRLVIVIISLTILSSFIFYRSIPPVRYFLGTVVNVYNQAWDQQSNYENNGSLLAFLFNAQSAIIFPPSGYSKERIEDIISRYSSLEETNDNQQQPDIIFIMSEAFWDPTLMGKVQFSEDPMPTIRKFQTGWAVSPEFGGKTSNVEFEALTGFSNAFLPVGSIVYQQYIQGELPSLPHYLASTGYKTLAIHPYAGWFYNRETVYPQLGFDDFLSIEDFVDPHYKGPYVSDQQMTRTIIKATEEEKEPLFIHAITMQNHTTYSNDRYEELDVSIEGPVSEESNGMLSTYTQGIADADQALADLISHYEQSADPALIVFFGDHLPSLGNNYKVYREAGMLPEGDREYNWTLDDHVTMKSTPLVVWKNFGDPIANQQHVSTSYLGELALEFAELPKPPYYQFLEELREMLPVFTREVKITADQELSKEIPKAELQLLEDYRNLQYDMLFGEHYSKKFFEAPE